MGRQRNANTYNHSNQGFFYKLLDRVREWIRYNKEHWIPPLNVRQMSAVEAQEKLKAAKWRIPLLVVFYSVVIFLIVISAIYELFFMKLMGHILGSLVTMFLAGLLFIYFARSIQQEFLILEYIRTHFSGKGNKIPKYGINQGRIKQKKRSKSFH